MRVMPNPARSANGRPITVMDPITRRPFPAEPFDLPDARLADPAILRLFPKAHEPGGRPGGVHGDLVPADLAPGDSGAVKPNPGK